MKVDTVSEIVIKTVILNVPLGRNLSNFFNVKIIYSKNNKDDIKNLEDLDDLQLKVKQVRLVEKLIKQGYHYDIKELFEPITKTLTITSQKSLEETKSKPTAIENLEETNKYFESLESMNKNGVIHSSMLRPITKLLVPKNKSQFRLLDDPDSDSWNDYKLHRDKVTIYDVKLHFGDTGLVFTLKGDILAMITDYDFNKTDSPGAKQIIDFLDEMHFDTHAKSKSFRDKNLIKKTFIGKELYQHLG